MAEVIIVAIRRILGIVVAIVIMTGARRVAALGIGGHRVVTMTTVGMIQVLIIVMIMIGRKG